MNNKTKSSIFAAAKETFVAMRKKWGIKPEYTKAGFAQMAGLTIVNLKTKPVNFEGYIDWHDEPRFIAVNQDLPAHAQAFFIARQIAFCAQKRRCNSLALDRPWKWETLDAAPDELKNKILLMDAEDRAHWFMLSFATGDEFRAFIRESPKRFWTNVFTDNIIRYHLYKLWLKLWFSKLCRKITIVSFPAS